MREITDEAYHDFIKGLNLVCSLDMCVEKMYYQDGSLWALHYAIESAHDYLSSATCGITGKDDKGDKNGED